MRERSAPGRLQGGRTTARLLVGMLVATAAGWGVCAVAVHAADVLVSDVGDVAALRMTVTVLVLLAGVVAVVLARRRPGWLAPYVVVATAVGVSGVATAALQRTRYGFNALLSDSAFRVEAITRFADSAALADYAYQDLPAYYPPAWPWLLGRTAALLDVPGWTVVKPAAVVAAAVVPLVAFLFWRRVLPAGQAAAVVLLTTLATANLQKPDEWLVLALLVPWWLEVVRGVRADGVEPRPGWLDGVIVGGLLLTHSVYFLPLGVATLLGWVVDLVRRTPPSLPLGRLLSIGAVAMVVSAPYWGSLLYGRLTAEASDSLQMRWSPVGTEVPPVPFEPRWWGVVAGVGVVWLLLRLRRDPRAAALALVLAGGYAVTVGGQWLQRYDVAVLAHKADPVVLSALLVAGVCAGAAALRAASGASSRPMPVTLRGTLLPVAVGVTSAALVVPAAGAFMAVWVEGDAAQQPHQLPYPDGSLPEGYDPEQAVNAWGTDVGDPSSEEVLRAWRELSGRGPEDDSRTVLLTTRADLLATTPVHPFTTWKSIYSHPAGRFDQRLALLDELASCGSSRCAAALLRENPFDRVDGVIATRVGDELRLPVAVDNFPEGWVAVDVVLPLRLFSGPPFRRQDVGPVTVVAVD